MKPIIIIKEKDVEEITLLQEELERIVDEAYEQGKKDGTIYYPYYPYWYYQYPTYGQITTTPNVTWKYDGWTSSSATTASVNTSLS